MKRIGALLKDETPRPQLQIVSAKAERIADIPPRTWFVDGMITDGTNFVTARKGIGKSFFALQVGREIAGGFPFLGRTTTKSKALYMTTELDRIALHERLQKYPPAPPGLFIHYGWKKGNDGIRDAETAFQEYGIKVLIVDMLSGTLPNAADTNSYDLSPFLLRWRQMAQRNQAAVVMVWHSSKTDRTDPMLGSAVMDRLVHRAVKLVIEGKSYRLNSFMMSTESLTAEPPPM